MQILRIVALAAGLAPSVVAADAKLPSQTCEGAVLFQCSVAGGKTLTLCHDEKGFLYQYGRLGAPELALNLSYEESRPQAPWHGVGRAISNSVILPNGDYSYTVWTAFDRLAEGDPVSGGVSVWQGDKLLADINCLSTPEPYLLSPFGIEDAMTEAGFIYDENYGRWVRE